MAVLGSDLQGEDLKESEGVAFAAGWASNVVWCEYSNDHGASQAQFADASYRKQVCALVVGEGEDVPRSTLLIYSTRELQVIVDMNLYQSTDGGETWALVTAV